MVDEEEGDVADVEEEVDDTVRTAFDAPNCGKRIVSTVLR